MRCDGKKAVVWIQQIWALVPCLQDYVDEEIGLINLSCWRNELSAEMEDG